MGRILYVAFLCCYFSYVIFPLCYSAQVHAGCGVTLAQAAHHQSSLKGVRLFLSELLSSLLQDDDDSDTHDALSADALPATSASKHVLLAKKRGLSSVKNILVKPAVCAVQLPEPCTILEASTTPIHPLVRAVKGFQFCHSGIAPPAV